MSHDAHAPEQNRAALVERLRSATWLIDLSEEFRDQLLLEAAEALATPCAECARLRTKLDVACGTIRQMQDEREQRRSYQVLASLSSWLSQGMGDGSVSATEYEARIREGLDHIIRVETSRREAAEAECARLRTLGFVLVHEIAEAETEKTITQLKNCLAPSVLSDVRAIPVEDESADPLRDLIVSHEAAIRAALREGGR